MSDRPTVDEIVESVKNSKPSFVDSLPDRKNTAPGTSADDMQKKIEEQLPAKAEEYKKRVELTKMFDTTSRAGAGGTKAGLVGIRPHGGKAASAFLENFTPQGRLRKPVEPFTQKQEFNDKEVIRDVKKPSVVLYEECMDCLGRVDPNDIVPNVTPLPTEELMNPEARARWAAVGIHPEEVVCWVYCGNCVRESMSDFKRWSAIPVHTAQGETTLGHIKLKERAHKIQHNVFEVLKRERMRGNDSDVFYGDCKYRS